MKLILVFISVVMLAVSCNDKNSNNSEGGSQATEAAADTLRPVFFPVTDFIKGQIADIQTRGINPIRITRVNEKEDSTWLKLEQFNDEFAAFLVPVIDSASVSGMFTEKTFLDQTINAFTFTYDPIAALPDSFQLQRWDVYVDPEKNTVKRIYILKKTPDQKTQQLTWQADRWCKIVTISPGKDGVAVLEKEVSIVWDY